MNSIVYMPYSYMSVVSSGFIVTNTLISDNEEGDVVLLEDDEDLPVVVAQPAPQPVAPTNVGSFSSPPPGPGPSHLPGNTVQEAQNLDTLLSLLSIRYTVKQI